MIDKNIYLASDNESVILQVNCHLEYTHKALDIEEVQEWRFSIYKASMLWRKPILKRLKVALRYILRGSIQLDQISVSPDDVNELKKFIENNNYGKCIER